MKKINYLILLIVVFIGASCEPKYEKEYSWAYPIAGDWTVKTYVNGIERSESYEIKAFNASYGKDSILIDDYGVGVAKSSEYGNFWTMKFKMKANVADKTFGNGTADVYNIIPDYEIKIKAANGKIIGTDSIYFEVKFEDDVKQDANGVPIKDGSGNTIPDPFGTTYQIKGHRTTAYDEYMHD